MPYIYTKSYLGKKSSWYTKDKSLKVGTLIIGEGEIVKIKYTKRDNIQDESSNLYK
jgi:hypothetical protein